MENEVCSKCKNEKNNNMSICDSCLNKEKRKAAVIVSVVFVVAYFIVSFISMSIAKKAGSSFYLTLSFFLLPILIRKRKKQIERRYIINEVHDNDNTFVRDDNTEQLQNNRTIEIPNDNISVIETNNTFIDKEDCKNEICNKKRYKLKPILTVIFILVLLLLGGLNIYQYIQLSKVTNKAETLQESLNEKYKTISALNEEVINSSAKYTIDTYRLEKELDFYREHVVFVTEDSNYFHSYDCEDFDSEFWAYNTELAIDMGYVPCPNCQ